MKRNGKKRVSCLLMAGLMIFSFTACGKTEAEGSKLAGSPLSMYDLLPGKTIDLYGNTIDPYGNTNQGTFGGNYWDNLNLLDGNELWELYSESNSFDPTDWRYAKLFSLMLEQEAFADLSSEIENFKNMLNETYLDPDMFCATDTTKIQPGDNIISVGDVIVNTLHFVKDVNTFTDYLNILYTEGTISGYEYLTKEQQAAMSEDELDAWMANAKTGLLNNNKRLQLLLQTIPMKMTWYYSIDGDTINCASIGIYNETKFRIDTEVLRKAIESDKEIAYKLIVMNVIPGLCEALDKTIEDIESYAGKSDDSVLGGMIFDFKSELGIED